jgi:hypothetical protein
VDDDVDTRTCALSFNRRNERQGIRESLAASCLSLQHHVFSRENRLDPRGTATASTVYFSVRPTVTTRTSKAFS